MELEEEEDDDMNKVLDDVEIVSLTKNWICRRRTALLDRRTMSSLGRLDRIDSCWIIFG